MNYKDVEDAVKEEIFNENKFEKVETTADQHIFTVRGKVNEVAKNLQRNDIIKMEDKILITGLTEKNKAKQAPEYRAESPYAYPSFKIHKMSMEDIANKKSPTSTAHTRFEIQPPVQM